MAVDTSLISYLEPIFLLSPGRQEEVAGLCFVEKVSKDIDPFRMNIVKNSQSLYLLKGNIGLMFEDGTKAVLHGGSNLARYPVGGGRSSSSPSRSPTSKSCASITTRSTS